MITTLIVIASILGYYFISRTFIIVYMILTKNQSFYNNWNEALSGTREEISIIFPIIGDFVFICYLISTIFFYPIYLFGRTLEKIISIFEERKRLKENRIKYLSSLSDFGLTPKDIPKYINDSKSLEEYLKVWNQAVKENRETVR